MPPRRMWFKKTIADNALGQRHLWLIRASNNAAAGTREIACSLGSRASVDLFRTKLRALVVQSGHHQVAARYRGPAVSFCWNVHA
jgi:hypothetical protein